MIAKLLLRYTLAAVKGCGKIIRPFIRLFFGCLLIASAVPKFMQPYDFLRAVYDYSLVGPRTGFYIALILPFLELSLAITLVTRFMERGAWLALAALMSIFTFARASAAMRSVPIACGCFSVNDPTPATALGVIETAVLLLIALAMFAWSNRVAIRDAEQTVEEICHVDHVLR